MKRTTTRSIGEMRMDRADYGRKQKLEESKCAYGTCMNGHSLRKGPDGWTGPYGGSMLCREHYPTIVDELVESLDEEGCAPWE